MNTSARYVVKRGTSYVRANGFSHDDWTESRDEALVFDLPGARDQARRENTCEICEAVYVNRARVVRLVRRTKP